MLGCLEIREVRAMTVREADTHTQRERQTRCEHERDTKQQRPRSLSLKRRPATADSNTLERTFQFIAIMIMIHIIDNNRMGSFLMIDRDIETHRKELRC